MGMNEIPEIEPGSEWGAWAAGPDDTGHIDPEDRIRVIAQHPDGGWIFEEIVTAGVSRVDGLRTMSEETLRGDYRPLPFRFSAEYIKGWLEKIEANQDDEVCRGEEEKLYRGVLRMLLVYPLEKDEQTAILKAMLDRPD